MARRNSFSSPNPSNSISYRDNNLTRRSITIFEKDDFKRYFSSRNKKSPIQQGLIDSADLHGKVKVLSNIRNSDTCLSTSFSSDGKYYAVALSNGLVNVLNSKNDNLIYILNKPESQNPHFTDTSCTCVRFKPFPSPKAAKLTDNHDDGLRVVNTNSHLLPKLVSLPTRRRSSISWSARGSITDIFDKDAEICKNNYLLTATFTDGTIKTFRFLTDECVQIIQEPRETLTMDYQPCGSIFVASGSDGILNIYSTETGQILMAYKPRFDEKAEFQRVYSITFHPENNNEFLAGGWDGKVRFYDMRAPKHNCQINDQFICGEGISFHPSGNEFCTASWNPKNSLQIYDYRTTTRLQMFDNYHQNDNSKLLCSSMLYSAKYYQDGKQLFLGGTQPGSLTVVDRSDGKLLAGIKNLRKSVYCVDVNKSNVLMVTGNEVSLLDFFI